MSCGGCRGVVGGAIAIAKNLAGVGVADEPTYKSRLRVCWHCDRAKPCLGIIGRKCQCAECGCIITEKAQRADQHCPITPDGEDLRDIIEREGHCGGRCKWCVAISQLPK